MMQEERTRLTEKMKKMEILLGAQGKRLRPSNYLISCFLVDVAKFFAISHQKVVKAMIFSVNDIWCHFGNFSDDTSYE